MGEPNRADYNRFQELLNEHRDFQKDQLQLTKIKSVLLDQLAKCIIGTISYSTLPTNSSGLGEKLERGLASEIIVVFGRTHRKFGFAEPNNMEGYLAPASNISLANWVEVYEDTIFFRSSSFRDEAVLPHVKDCGPKLRSLVTLEKSTEQQRIKLIEDLDDLIIFQWYDFVISDLDNILKWAYDKEFKTQSELLEEGLLSLTQKYLTEKHKQSSDESAKTLYDKVITRSKNNPLIVAVAIILLCLAGAAAFKTYLKTLFSHKKPPNE